MDDFDIFSLFSVPCETAECIAIINACIKALPKERENFAQSFSDLAKACEKYLAEYNK